LFDVSVSLLENNLPSDAAFPQRFGFREFWIESRDFYLNGTRIFLSTVPFDNAQAGAALVNYEDALESMRRLKSFGINMVYAHNYGCEPGTYLSFAEILKAADDCEMLISLSSYLRMQLGIEPSGSHKRHQNYKHSSRLSGTYSSSF
jgi:hypothetical protein